MTGVQTCALPIWLDEELVDFGRGEIPPCSTLLDEIIELIGDDAEALDSVNEIEHLRTIIKKGTSSHRQLAIYAKAPETGASRHDALIGAVDMLIKETRDIG